MFCVRGSLSWYYKSYIFELWTRYHFSCLASSKHPSRVFSQHSYLQFEYQLLELFMSK